MFPCNVLINSGNINEMGVVFQHSVGGGIDVDPTHTHFREVELTAGHVRGREHTHTNIKSGNLSHTLL